ncbi:MAG TPA: hypothetical protein VF170_06065 [Planctomycetaceae bacterium]
MPSRRRLLAGAALAGLSAFSLAADEVAEPVRPVTIVASPAILPQGAACRVELVATRTGARSTSRTTYEGTIVEAAADGVRIAVTSEEHEGRHEGFSTGLPFIDRHFKSSGVAVTRPNEGKEVWLPTAKIESITLIETAAENAGR